MARMGPRPDGLLQALNLRSWRILRMRPGCACLSANHTKRTNQANRTTEDLHYTVLGQEPLPSAELQPTRLRGVHTRFMCDRGSTTVDQPTRFRASQLLTPDGTELRGGKRTK